MQEDAMSFLSHPESPSRYLMWAAIVALTTLLLGLDPAHSQEPDVKAVLEQEEAQKEAPAASEGAPRGPLDELNRGTPRSSYLGLAEAAREGDYERAAEYLDLRNLPEEVLEIGGPEIARRLKIVLDRALWIDVDTLSTDPQGVSDDGLPPYRDSLGRIEIDGKPTHIYLQRVPREDGVSIWKISNATIGKVPELHEIYGYGPIGERLSKAMPDFELLGLQTWQWLMLIGLLGIGYLVALVPTWFVDRLLRRRQTGLGDELARLVSGPIRWLIAVVLTRSWIDVIHPGVTARAWMEGHTILTIMVAWVMIALVGVFHRQWSRQLEASGRIQAVVLARPAANVLRVLIVVIAVMIWLENLGFRATTLIAGLGIGGLAVALAAQKPIENLIGAITLFASAPVRVGDFCRYGDKIGTVEEIGLRATKIRTLGRTAVYVPNTAFADMQLENFAERDRVWYHPTIRLRYDTTPNQVRFVLVEIRRMLYSHPKVDPEPARVRFIGYGDGSLDLEIFAYVLAPDWNQYLEVAEDLNLRTMDIIEQAGTALAHPAQTVSLEQGRRPNEEAARTAEAKVEAWRREGQLFLPSFPEQKISELRGTLPYPPEGSATPAAT
jgi:MscS family membrane protein